VEVKRHEDAALPSRGWTGEAFTRKTLRTLAGLVDQHRRLIAGAGPVEGVAFIRPNGVPWAVWVAHETWAEVFDLPPGRAYGIEPVGEAEWVRLPVEVFFDLVAGAPVVEGIRVRRQWYPGKQWGPRRGAASRRS
jgi:hypothetical protein